MIERRVFPNSPDVVADARRYATQRLRDCTPEVLDVVALMVSELATNCVRHTASDFTLEVEQTAHHMRVQVTDNGTGEPKVRSPLPTEPSGRGLRIVEELADSFGIDYSSEKYPRTKTVWFVVQLDELPTRSGIAQRPTQAGPGTTRYAPGARESEAGTSRPDPASPRHAGMSRLTSAHTVLLVR